MKFFVTEEKRKASHSTCYFEFQKGRYRNKCWLPDSISIRDDLWNKYCLSDLIRQVIKEFDYCGITEVTKNQWNEIVKLSQEAEADWKQVIEDATAWVNDCFKKYDVFTICGL